MFKLFTLKFDFFKFFFFAIINSNDGINHVIIVKNNDNIFAFYNNLIVANNQFTTIRQRFNPLAKTPTTRPIYGFFFCDAIYFKHYVIPIEQCVFGYSLTVITESSATNILFLLELMDNHYN